MSGTTGEVPGRTANPVQTIVILRVKLGYCGDGVEVGNPHAVGEVYLRQVRKYAITPSRTNWWADPNPLVPLPAIGKTPI
jgi:hypothetical protein